MFRALVILVFSGFFCVVLSGCSGTGSVLVSGQASRLPASVGSSRTISTSSAITAAALPSESAVSSTAFVDSIGINAQFEEPAYNATIRSLIANSRIRHYRVAGSNIGAGGTYLRNLVDLYDSFGYKFDVEVNLKMPPAEVVEKLALLPAGSIDSVEGPNEADTPDQGQYYDPNFGKDVPEYMRSLHTTLKASAFSQVTIVAPSFAKSTSYAAIGNISSDVDTGNMHNYFAGFNPGTSGWGGDGYPFAPHLHYGSIEWNIASAGQSTGTKPISSTETGYCNAPVHSCVPLDVQAKYVPRLYLEEYRDLVPRTFLYQFIGENATTTSGTLDIVSSSGVPTPAYHALAGLISLLYDGGAESGKRNYNWDLTGNTADVHHVLMHKADGTFVVALWIEVPSFNPNANGGLGAKIRVPQQAVTVNLAQKNGTAVVWTCNPATGAWSRRSLTVVNGSITLDVADSASILEVGPA